MKLCNSKFTNVEGFTFECDRKYGHAEEHHSQEYDSEYDCFREAGWFITPNGPMEKKDAMNWDELDALHAASTEPEWSIYTDDYGSHEVRSWDASTIAVFPSRNEAYLIVALRNAYPAIRDYVLKLKREAEAGRVLLEDVRVWLPTDGAHDLELALEKYEETIGVRK